MLGLKRDANDEAIRKAYRDKSIKYHPDRRGPDANPELFAKCTRARDILSAPRLRAAYDRGGMSLVERVEENERAMAQQAIPKCDPLSVKHEVTLKQIWAGETIKFSIDVPKYSASAGATSSAETVAQFPFEFKLVADVIDKTIVVENKGIEKPDHIPGDIHVTISVKEDPSISPFHTVGADLVLDVPLSLGDIIRGYNVAIKHPDGLTYTVSGRYSPPDDEDENGFVMELFFPGMGLGKGRGSVDSQMILRLKPSLDILQELNDSRKNKILEACRGIKGLEPTPAVVGDKDISKASLNRTQMTERLRAAQMKQFGLMGGIPMMGGFPPFGMAGPHSGSHYCRVQ